MIADEAQQMRDFINALRCALNLDPLYGEAGSSEIAPKRGERRKRQAKDGRRA